MSLDRLDEDPHDPEPPLRKRLARRVLGDPRKAPSRLLYLLIFALIAVIVVGIWSVIQTESDPSGSSYWFVRALASVFNTMWVLVPLALYLYWRYVGVLRTRHATKAADITGWLAETIEHLSDEMRSTDGTTRVIVTTDHSLDDIKSNVDAALRGDPHDSEEVDYYGRSEDTTEAPEDAIPIEATGETADADSAAGDDPESRVEELEQRESELLEEQNRLSEEIEDCFDSALDAGFDVRTLQFDSDESASLYDLMDEDGQDNVETAEELLEELEAVEAELEGVWEELEAAYDDRIPDAPEPDPETVDGTSEEMPADSDWSTGLDDSLDDEIYGELEVYDEEDDDSPETIREAWAAGSGVRGTLGSVKRHLYRRSVDAVVAGVSLFVGALAAAWAAITGSVRSWLSMDPAKIDEPEEFEVPWKVRFAEELKHLFLDLSASLHSDEVIWKFGLPTGMTFVFLMLVAKLWVHPLLYLVFIAVAVLVGMFVFWLSKKRRSRRLKTHRQTESWSYWDDAAGRVKTVETADVTCYMGWLSGRRYASYNREEFIHGFSRRLHQRTHDERVAPSVLEQYARNIAQMKPNLRGHLERFERPMIQEEIKHAVETSNEQIIDKAGLAMEVIEHPQEDKRVTTDLGHDPRLVAQEYQWLVEEGHVLSEVDVEFEDASGRTTTKTLVYPTDKTRLPDMEALHSQFSDRFTGSHGEPYYNLPDCNPTDDLQGFEPTPKVAEMFRPEEGGA